LEDIIKRDPMVNKIPKTLIFLIEPNDVFVSCSQFHIVR